MSCPILQGFLPPRDGLFHLSTAGHISRSYASASGESSRPRARISTLISHSLRREALLCRRKTSETGEVDRIQTHDPFCDGRPRDRMRCIDLAFVSWESLLRLTIDMSTLPWQITRSDRLPALEELCSPVSRICNLVKLIMFSL